MLQVTSLSNSFSEISVINMITKKRISYKINLKNEIYLQLEINELISNCVSKYGMVLSESIIFEALQC